MIPPHAHPLGSGPHRIGKRPNSPRHPHGATRGALLALVALLVLVGISVWAVIVAITTVPARGPGSGDEPTDSRVMGVGRGVPVSVASGDLARAGEAFREGDYARAAALLEPLVAADPKAEDPRLLLAQVYCGLKRYPDAHQQVEAVLAQAGPSAPAALRFDAGTIANQAGAVERAAEHYAAAQAADPREPRYPLYLAMIQIKLGQDGPAMASLVRAVNLAPDLAEGWGTLGELELRSGSLGLALDHLRKARVLQPGSARWRLGEAKVLKRQGDPEAAAAIIVALDPADRQTRDALAQLGECMGLLGRPRIAAEAYAEAAAARAGSADEAEFHAKAAEWFERAGDADLAGKHARRAAELGYGPAQAK